MATLRRCMRCGNFHPKRDTACPACGQPRPAFSSHLHTAKLNQHLYAQAAAADANR